jgi:hypothetical protein
VVEPQAAGVDPASLRMPAAFERLDGPPVFVCGSARSGTTWTFDLFDRHPEVSAVNESWVLSQTHGVTTILTQQYWDLAAKRAWEERVDVPFGTRQLVSYEEMVADLSETVAGWYTRRMKPGERFLVAKEPIDVRAAAILFPEARFIHVIRDGREVALSMRRASETWDPTMGVGLPMTLRAEAWRRQVANVRDHRELLGDRYVEARYERMRADVATEARSMFEFAGIPHDAELLESIRASTRITSYEAGARASGFRGGGGGASWREGFSLRDAIGFRRAAGDLLVELGYEPDRRWWRSRR